MEFQKNGGAHISGLIRQALENGTRRITVTGNWEMEASVRIPSDFTVILENCHLRQGDGTFCNIFLNESCGLPVDKDRNIRIIGIGKAILDGGNYNGLSERTSLKNGYPHISLNNLILFANVDGFTVEGLQLKNQRWWAMNFLFCRHGVIRNIDFDSNPLLLTPTYENYESILVKNADGIDLRAGCHDILIENITGFTEDDTVACTCLFGNLERMFAAEGANWDLYNIIIRNVCASAYCGHVRVLNQGGTKVYNILIDGVMDTSKGDPRVQSPRASATVRIGDRHMYGQRHSEGTETMNITVRNIYSRAYRAVDVVGAIKNLVIDNINGFDGCESLITNDAVNVS